jgi:hypothetical protein
MADARAATRLKGSTPKLRAGAGHVTDAARTTNTERASAGEAAASTNVIKPWAISFEKSPLRAMAPPLNTGRVGPGKLALLEASIPVNAVPAL